MKHVSIPWNPREVGTVDGQNRTNARHTKRHNKNPAHSLNALQPLNFTTKMVKKSFIGARGVALPTGR